MSDYSYKAKGRVVALIETLEKIIERDPEQEVLGMAVPVLDACIEDTSRMPSPVTLWSRRWRD